MAESRPTISSSDSRLRVVVDPRTALPIALIARDSHGEMERALRVTVAAHINGQEGRGWTGGLRYDDPIELTELVVDTATPTRVHRGICDERSFSGRLGPLRVRILYRLFPNSPLVEVAMELAADAEVLVRNVRVTIDVPGDPSKQIVNMPGNAIHRDLLVDELGDEPFGISPIGGLRGSSGIITVGEGDSVLSVWPNQPAEIPDIVTSRLDDGLQVRVDTSFAAAIGAENSAELLLATLDLQRGDFSTIATQWPDWASRYGLTSPPEKPSWSRDASIYEVQIGTSYFWGGNSYSRYLEIEELTADLDRIEQLGFSVIQLMPRQPYPSYNVHDYADISTSYGDEEQLRELVRRAHARGMKIILDVLLHGVLDNESMDMAIQGIADGPLAARLDEETGDSFGTDLSDSTNYFIAWSRHILDFADAWKGGSPQRTPLQDTHPKWFSRDSAGNVTGVYTKAFDARHPDWQDYFRESMMNLLTGLDVDGFRFDAPTYNDFANWADWARARASLSPLGCVSLFVELRRDIKGAKPEALMYTEPSGHLLRRSMDVNYNYDEQWLVTSLSDPLTAPERGVTCARQFMEWMEDRDSFLPVGAQTAHHLDSHDTFWWPQWGKKWRREQFGIEKVRALTCSLLTLDGPFMMFTGGEEGIEAELRVLNGLRRDYPELWARPAQFDTVTDPTGHLFIATRSATRSELRVIANLTGSEAVGVAPELSAGWTVIAETGFGGGVLEPAGYVVATRSGG